jgi:hypothetical protein
VAEGLPVRPDGQIDVADGLAWIEDNLDPARRNKGCSPAAPTGPGRVSTTLVEAKRLHEIVKVQRAKLAFEREQGQLIETVAATRTQSVITALIKQARKLPKDLYRSLTWDRGSTTLGDTEDTLVQVLLPVPELTRSWYLLSNPDVRSTPRVAAFVDHVITNISALKSALIG